MKLLEKTLDVFDTKVTIRELSIGQTMELNKLEPEEVMIEALVLAIVKPVYTSSDLRDMPVRYMNDLITLSGAFYIPEPEEEEVKKK